MVRGVYVDRAGSERLTLKEALERYLREVSPTKRPSTAKRERQASDALVPALGDYALAALTPDVIASYRDGRLADGKSPDTVRIELALLSHLFTTALREWRVGLVYNPVLNVRKPPSGAGRNRRLSADEEQRLLKSWAQHSNPMLGWLVRVALHTGMRVGEIQSLRRDQVDVERRIVKLEVTKNGSAKRESHARFSDGRGQDTAIDDGGDFTLSSAQWSPCLQIPLYAPGADVSPFRAAGRQSKHTITGRPSQ